MSRLPCIGDIISSARSEESSPRAADEETPPATFDVGNDPASEVFSSCPLVDARVALAATSRVYRDAATLRASLPSCMDFTNCPKATEDDVLAYLSALTFDVRTLPKSQRFDKVFLRRGTAVRYLRQLDDFVRHSRDDCKPFEKGGPFDMWTCHTCENAAAEGACCEFCDSGECQLCVDNGWIEYCNECKKRACVSCWSHGETPSTVCEYCEDVEVCDDCIHSSSNATLRSCGTGALDGCGRMMCSLCESRNTSKCSGNCGSSMCTDCWDNEMDDSRMCCVPGCTERYCGPCHDGFARIATCDGYECGRDCCLDCMTSCDYCDRFDCDDCFADGGGFKCWGCLKVKCERCQEMSLPPRRCRQCASAYCGKSSSCDELCPVCDVCPKCAPEDRRCECLLSGLTVLFCATGSKLASGAALVRKHRGKVAICIYNYTSSDDHITHVVFDPSVGLHTFAMQTLSGIKQRKLFNAFKERYAQTYDRAKAAGKTLVTLAWIDDFVKTNAIIPLNMPTFSVSPFQREFSMPTFRRVPPPFIGGVPEMRDVVVCLSGYEGERRANLEELLSALGATYEPGWTSKCTHLVCWEFAGFRWIRSRALGTDLVKVVSHKWVQDCAREWKRVPEPLFSSCGKFEFDDLAASLPARSPAKKAKPAAEKDFFSRGAAPVAPAADGAFERNCASFKDASKYVWT